MPLEEIKHIRDIPIEGKSVFMRLDFNVPISKDGKVEDDTRIQEALPTIKHALERGAKVVMASHLGRPDGKPSPEFSLEPVAAHLSGLLNMDVTLTDDCVGEGIELMARGLKGGQVLLLENLRFHKGEEENDSEFAHKLSHLCEVYINDAFGTAHRKHASTYGVPTLMHTKGMGLLIEKELKFFDRILHHPEPPFYFILGGAKVSDKIKTVESLMRKVSGLLIGGAMANAFFAAEGKKIPANAKQPSPKDIEAAQHILRDTKKRDIPVLLPVDTIDSFDIGPKTVQEFTHMLQGAKTIFWNGPLGWFEKPEYSSGTFEMAKAIATLPALKIIGGGDTVSAVKSSGVAESFDHLSTGGGAALEYLEGHGLPGIDILKIPVRNQNLPE
jgi:phosphoglycerate kinase